MKVLVHNYSSEASTEPRYISQSLKIIGEEAFLWSGIESAFDIFDTVEPDVFIGHFAHITKDAVKRLKGTNIKVLLNVSGAPNEAIENIVQNIDNVTFFSNTIVPPCADIFLGNIQVEYPAYNVSKLFVISHPEDLVYFKSLKDSGSHHYITPIKDIEGVDAFVPITHLPNIYHRYDNVVVSAAYQMFYDAAYYNNNCRLKNKNVDVLLTKEEIQENHTPFHRVATLFNLIGHHEIEEKIKAKL